MNIKSHHDLSFVKTLEKALNLGASTKDIVNLFPERFSSEPRMAISKARRYYKDIKPDRILLTARKSRTLRYMLSCPETAPSVNNFAKFAIPYINDATLNEDLSSIFIECFADWVNACSEPISLQDAQTIFKHVFLANGVSSYSGFKTFLKCKDCGSTFLNPVDILARKLCACPYCSSKSLFGFRSTQTQKND